MTLGRLLTGCRQYLHQKYRAWYLQARSWKSDPYGRFLRDGGNDLLVSDLNLDKECWVIDFGGFKGDWAAAVLSRYQVKCLIVEPVPIFATAISDRFRGQENVHVMPFLFGRSKGTQVLHLAEDATGSNARGCPVVVEQQPISTLLDMLGQEMVGIASINIEGGEYELLEMLFDSGGIRKFNSLLIQFHYLNDHSPKRYMDLQLSLRTHYKLIWDYPYVWQRWDRK